MQVYGAAWLACHALQVRDPRVSSEEAERFLSMMELYFGRPAEEKATEVRPHLHYQVQSCFKN